VLSKIEVANNLRETMIAIVFFALLIAGASSIITDCNRNSSSPQCELRSTCVRVGFLSRFQVPGQPAPFALDFLDSCAFDEDERDAQLRIMPVALSEMVGDSQVVKSVAQFASISSWRATIDSDARRFELAVQEHSIADLCDPALGAGQLCFDMFAASELFDANRTLVTTIRVSGWDWANASTSFAATFAVSVASLFTGKLTSVEQLNASRSSLLLRVQTAVSAFEMQTWTAAADGSWTWSLRDGRATLQFASRQQAEIALSFSVRALSSPTTTASKTDGDAHVLLAGVPEQQFVVIVASCSAAALVCCIIVIAIIAHHTVRKRRRAQSH
jgi:hypothetical protein